MTAPLGVVLMTFGTADGAEDVPRYLRSVRGGTDAPPELVDKFRARFAQIGGSPLLRITQEQTEGLQRHLDGSFPGAFRVAMGMLHCRPSIEEAISGLVSDDATAVLAIALAPQYSPLILRGYEMAIEAARQQFSIPIATAKAWHQTDAWLDSLTERVREALRELPTAQTHVIFSAHSLPKSVVERDPAYIEQLVQTASALQARLQLNEPQSTFAWQSAGHSAQEWLRPDLKELFPDLRERGYEHVLIVPIQFVADHLEILYDLDIAARAEAEEHGLQFHRIAMPNASPRFIEALAEVVMRETSTAELASMRN